MKTIRAHSLRALCAWLFPSLFVLAASSLIEVRGATVGNWNLSPWVYLDSTNPYSVSTTMIQSNGTTPVGLSGTVNASRGIFIFGSASGTVTHLSQFNVLAQLRSSYSFLETFKFSSSVNFGPAATQSQFSEAASDNGLGLMIKTHSSQYISDYDIVFTLTGGAIFSALEGDFGSFGPATGVGTNAITLQWEGGFLGLVDAIFNGIRITGDLSEFTISHSVFYDNTFNNEPLDIDNTAAFKINTIPEPSSVLLLAAAGCTVALRRRCARGNV